MLGKKEVAAKLNHLTPGEKLVVFSLLIFSVLAVIDYFLLRSQAIYFLPLNIILILLFLKLSDWQHKYQNKPVVVFLLSASPLAAYAYLYKLAGSLIRLITSTSCDGFLASLDLAIFGVSPNQWVTGLYRPWLTEIMMLSYVAYLPLVAILAYLLFRQRGRQQSDLYIFSLGLAYLVCFILFIIFPATSPRFYFGDLHQAPGYFFRWLMNQVEAWGQFQGGSFPSAHCAAGTVMIYFSFKAGRKTFSLIFPLILLFFLSTVYGQYHYVVDIIAGIIIGVIALLATGLIDKRKASKFSLAR
ncbi:MAG: phosphatase PAP2 family protein [Acidobacteriota bacterium]|nr:phosphatase PAP2 family protein [Acidobacteriota bacterium]